MGGGAWRLPSCAHARTRADRRRVRRRPRAMDGEGRARLARAPSLLRGHRGVAHAPRRRAAARLRAVDQGPAVPRCIARLAERPAAVRSRDPPGRAVARAVGPAAWTRRVAWNEYQ